jgi:anaerobic C4-dicarboxylate transporter
MNDDSDCGCLVLVVLFICLVMGGCFSCVFSGCGVTVKVGEYEIHPR